MQANADAGLSPGVRAVNQGAQEVLEGVSYQSGL